MHSSGSTQVRRRDGLGLFNTADDAVAQTSMCISITTDRQIDGQTDRQTAFTHSADDRLPWTYRLSRSVLRRFYAVNIYYMTAGYVILYKHTSVSIANAAAVAW